MQFFSRRVSCSRKHKFNHEEFDYVFFFSLKKKKTSERIAHGNKQPHFERNAWDRFRDNYNTDDRLYQLC